MMGEPAAFAEKRGGGRSRHRTGVSVVNSLIHGNLQGIFRDLLESDPEIHRQTPATMGGLRLNSLPKGAYLIRDRGFCLRKGIHSARWGHGHTRPTDHAAVAMAERICREAYRVNPTGLP